MKRRLSLSRHKSTAGSVPEFLKKSELWARISTFSSRHLNFYRIHLLTFTFVPFIISGIFYASNGSQPRGQIAYIDCLFLCVSAMTVTGLNSVELGRLTTWQQFLIFFQMSIGSTSFVSIIVVMVRRQFFRNKFEWMVKNDENARSRVNKIGEQEARLHGRSFEPFTETHLPGNGPSLAQLFFQRSQPNTPRPSPAGSASASFAEGERDRGLREGLKKKKKKLEKLSADMIRRIDVPVRINEMSVSGWLGEGREDEARSPETGVALEQIGKGSGQEEERLPEVFADEDSAGEEAAQTRGDDLGEESSGNGATTQPSVAGRTIQISEPFPPQHGHIQISEPPQPVHNHRRRASDTAATASPLRLGTGNLPRIRTLEPRQLDHITESPTSATPRRTSFGSNPDHSRDFGRSRTIEFRENSDNDLRLRRNRTLNVDPDVTMRRMSSSNLRDPYSRALTRTGTANGPGTDSARTTGFGGFPNPIFAAAGAAAGFARNRIPTLRNAVDRTVTRTTTLRSTHSIDSRMGTTTFAGSEGPNVKQVNYISFDAVVGRNSRFHGLTDAQREELGGVEYRALTLLLKLVAGYYLVGQLLAVLVLAPWLTYSGTYRPVFENPAWEVNPTWFVFFQVWSAYSNNGMSLVDTSMIPFGRAYWLIIVMSILIVGGNTGLPVFLRLTIWFLSKIVPSQSRLRETLEFLLAHPRRCYIYLFPSHETWYLVFALVCLNGFDWASFLILDIGNEAIEAIPLGTRFIDGLFQSFAVRAAGFGIVPLGQLSPAVQFLYTVMMYIAVYPIALSIRATNVYEEKSMGVYDEDLDDSEADFDKTRSATQYIGFHARKQLAWDIWFIVLSVWLLAIIERGRIRSGDWPEVNVFTLIFESVSAYGTVGLSLGNNRNNASLSGILSTLSKLVLIALMIRGRHRGLPIAIDRAVLLPSDLEAHADDTVTSVSQDAPLPRTRTSRSSYTGPTEVEDARSRTNSIFVESPQVIESTGFGEGDKSNETSTGGTTPSSATDSNGKSVESEQQGEPPHDPNQVGWR
ncbi:uncharacterized protein JCM6883_006933 [Sporobolomyces salmoneus]|uniref:uncharacterized protein n=1 Tax=Sporobolomyces salmoneus TaxID=183962 RepID=UPI0031759020